MLRTAGHEAALAAALGALQADRTRTADKNSALVLDALAKARALASRLGDDSKLTLDPDLDSYYLQSIVVTRLPTLATQLGEIQSWLRDNIGSGPLAAQGKAHILALDSLLGATADSIRTDIAAALRGAAGARLRQAIDAPFGLLAANTADYLGAVRAGMDAGDARAADLVGLEKLYSTSCSAFWRRELTDWSARETRAC
jgi:methyl-accepting chemotaxis protein